MDLNTGESSVVRKKILNTTTPIPTSKTNVQETTVVSDEKEKETTKGQTKDDKISNKKSLTDDEIKKTTVLSTIWTSLMYPYYRVKSLQDKINNNWDQLKCTHIGTTLIMAGMGPKEQSIVENQKECEASKFSTMFNAQMGPHTANLGFLGGVTAGLSNDVQSVRKKFQSVEKTAYHDLGSVYTKIYKAYGRIAQLYVTLMKNIAQIMKIFVSILGVIRYSWLAFTNVFDGPMYTVYKIAKYLGFF